MDDATNATCRTCGKSDFHPVVLTTTAGPLFIMLGFLKSVMVQSQVCLACGTITQSLDAKALDAIRASKAKQDAKAAGR